MRKLLSSLVILALAAVPASANLLTDGTFEIGDTTGPGDWHDYLAGNTMGAWDVVTNDVMLFGTDAGGTTWAGTSVVGDEHPNLGSGYASGMIEQSFATTPGQLYELSYWAREYPGTKTTTGEVWIRVYNGSGDDLNVTGTYDRDWGQSTYQFTATEAISTLEFQNAGWDGANAPDGVSLDDVQVVLVPEPASLCLLGLGGLLLRRKR